MEGKDALLNISDLSLTYNYRNIVKLQENHFIQF